MRAQNGRTRDDDRVKRRDFLKQTALAAGATGAAAIAGCSRTDPDSAGAPALATKRWEWTMVTTWPPTLPIMMDGARLMAEQIETMSQGRLKIRVFGGGELVPPFESFDAVVAGTAQMSSGVSYYWAGKAPAAQFFGSIPFGMNAQQMYAWLFSGGGLELWTELYDELGVVPIPAGNTGAQMGGWFNREIESVADFEGLKMRIPGLGGRVISELGASAVLLPGGEIYTSLERGVIDATEWIGPYHDRLMGFQNVVKNYYYPGWHEPGTVLELAINRAAWDELPDDLQQMVRSAAEAQNLWMLTQFESRNHEALQKLVAEDGVALRQFPAEVLATLRETTRRVVEELAASDPLATRIYDSFRSFQDNVGSWGRLSEQPFYNLVQDGGRATT